MDTLLIGRLLDLSLRPASQDLPDSGADVLGLLIDALAHGVVIIDARGHIAYTNPVARDELGRQRMLARSNNKINPVCPVDAKALQAAMVKAGAGKRSLIHMSGAGVGMTLAVVPLRCDIEAREARIALLFARAEVCESGVFGFFARHHGLTQTEELVLMILCRGLSTPEIALEMKIAVSTVRSHVRSLCAKTASSGVRELVNRVAVLPPVAPVPLAQMH